MVQSAALIRQRMTFGYFDAGGVRGTVRVRKKRVIRRKVLRGCGWDACKPSIGWAFLLLFPSVEGLICTSRSGVCHRATGWKRIHSRKPVTLKRKPTSLCGRCRICREWIRGTLNSINSDGAALWGSVSSLPNFFYFHVLENHLVQWTET